MGLINKKNMFLLDEIIRRNFSAKYKDSYLGILWSFIKPLLMMILLTIIFSSLFRQTIENYPVYVISGKCIYDFFNTCTNSSLYAIKSNIGILKRTAAPKHIFVLGGVFSEFINFKGTPGAFHKSGILYFHDIILGIIHIYRTS